QVEQLVLHAQEDRRERRHGRLPRRQVFHGGARRSEESIQLVHFAVRFDARFVERLLAHGVTLWGGPPGRPSAGGPAGKRVRRLKSLPHGSQLRCSFIVLPWTASISYRPRNSASAKDSPALLH